MSGLRCQIRGIGVLAPGMPDWATARPVLRGEQPREPAPPELPAPAALPANERRRVTALVRLALAVAGQALGEQDDDFASVFASSEGDLFITDRICRALLMPERPVSPTLFHNSVHNAPAGYLSIARQNRAPYSSISAVDGTAAAGLLEAVTQLVTEGRDVLLVVYDAVPPEPLRSRRPIAEPFGASLLLVPETTGASAGRLELEPVSADAAVTACAHPRLEDLCRTNPAARILPLLIALAEGTAQTVVLPGDGNTRLQIRVRP